MTFPFSEGAFGPFAAPTLYPQPDGASLGGKHFYVNPAAGSTDDTGGPWPELQRQGVAFEGITGLQAAIDASVADRGDVIHVRRGYWAPTATINFNKQGITVIGQVWGMSPRHRGEFCTIDSSHTDGPAARITKGCTIIGLGFAGAQASGDNSKSSTVVLDGTGAATDAYGTWFKDCRFVNWNRDAVNYGVYLRGVAGIRIDNCNFKGGNTYSFEAGVLIDNDVTGGGGQPSADLEFVDNDFHDTRYAFEIVTGSQYGPSWFKRNTVHYDSQNTRWGRFLLDNSATASAGISKNMIMDNYIGLANTASYYNNSGAMTVADLETYGYRFGDNHYAADG